ncbi:ribose-phosphate diphosphokinase [Sphingobium sp. DEHP117]|uniref:ribose-phosphate diphosphokinase n=1 Tax=Sphingobium sp. DEHP117 TaxID=2993436 RepID=UPI0027D769F4|nr:ribose-phosphate diphosphokinase [Sphingobium sp. DEHP117]MDQ4419489.1 ribose-phosphate diphosphokinase [Sphingobium sp. DEHP117]
MSTTLHYFMANRAEAQRLASGLGIASLPIETRPFPDGESFVRVGKSTSTALLYCSLDRPDAKMVPLLLAASALRDGGANRIVLIAPYLCYMRQDRAFSAGEAVSQRVIGKLIAASFDGLITVDPHLHRTPSLQAVAPGIVAITVSAAATIARTLATMTTPDTLLVGPDEESRQWVDAIAAPLGLDVMICTKTRRGDRTVEIALPDKSRASGRPVMLVDDIISSGGTLNACARLLRAGGATRISAVATHCLANGKDLDSLFENGIDPVRATDTIPGPAADISIAPALAEAICAHNFV